MKSDLIKIDNLGHDFKKNKNLSNSEIIKIINFYLEISYIRASFNEMKGINIFLTINYIHEVKLNKKTVFWQKSLWFFYILYKDFLF